MLNIKVSQYQEEHLFFFFLFYLNVFEIIWKSIFFSEIKMCILFRKSLFYRKKKEISIEFSFKKIFSEIKII